MVRHIIKNPTLVVAAIIFAVAATTHDYIVRVHNRAENRLARQTDIFASTASGWFQLAHVVVEALHTEGNAERWYTWAVRGHEELNEYARLPTIRHILVFDKNGIQQHASFTDSPARLDITDREYFQALKAGKEETYFGPYVGRNTGRYSYAIARRLEDKKGDFDGLILLVMAAEFMNQECQKQLIYTNSSMALLAPNGKIISACGQKNDIEYTHETDGMKLLAGGEIHRGGKPVQLDGDRVAYAQSIDGLHPMTVLTIIDVRVLRLDWARHYSIMVLLYSTAIFLLLVVVYRVATERCPSKTPDTVKE